MKKYIVPYVDILVYSLMPTHYHVLGRVKQQPSQTSQTSEVFKTSEVSVSRQVSLAMQKFGISYTKAINKRFSRVGALFQGQFQGKPIQTYAHLLNLCVYIHANPVKDRLVSLPEEWEYSNYLEWMGLRDGTLVKREFILEHFGSPEDYKQLILNYIKTRYLSDDFRKYVQEFEERKFCAIGDGIVKNRQK